MRVLATLAQRSSRTHSFGHKTPLELSHHHRAHTSQCLPNILSTLRTPQQIVDVLPCLIRAHSYFPIRWIPRVGGGCRSTMRDRVHSDQEGSLARPKAIELREVTTLA
jgi:hypothetical protein